MMIDFGDFGATCSVTLFTIPALVSCSCSRVIPGLRAIPAVITMMSEPAVAA